VVRWNESSVRAREHVRCWNTTATTSQEEVKRYEIRWASLDPTTGAEVAKTRPVVIVSLDVLNERLSTVTVCPLTSQIHPTWRTRLGVRAAGREAEIAVDQIRTISKSRIGKKLGVLTAKDAASLRRLITEMYGE
jgi:mRNA interferase MazF